MKWQNEQNVGYQKIDIISPRMRLLSVENVTKKLN